MANGSLMIHNGVKRWSNKLISILKISLSSLLNRKTSLKPSQLSLSVRFIPTIIFLKQKLLMTTALNLRCFNLLWLIPRKAMLSLISIIQECIPMIANLHLQSFILLLKQRMEPSWIPSQLMTQWLECLFYKINFCPALIK
jgi:hypothetical protein